MGDLQKEIMELRAGLRAKEQTLRRRVAQDPATLAPEDRSRRDRAVQGLQILAALDEGQLPPQLQLYLQGASANFSEEIQALFRDPAFDLMADKLNANIQGQDPVSGYDLARARINQPIDQYRDEKPLQAMGIEAAGAATTALATGGAGALLRGVPAAARAISAAPTVSRAKQAAGAGALAGVGAGDGLEDRLFQGGLGAGAGMATQKILDMASAPVRQMAQNFKSTKTATKQGRAEARKLLREAIDADLTTPEEAITYVGNMLGKDVTLADIGDNTRALIDVLSVLPGPGKTTANRYLERRQQMRPTRLGTILQEAFGRRANFYNDFQAIKAARKKGGDTLYGVANKVDVPVNDDLRALFQTNAVQKAYQRALRIAQNSPDNPGIDKFMIAESGDILDRDGNAVTEINSRFLHFIKMGLDDEAFPGGVDTSGIGATERQGVRDVRNAFLEFFDNANPQYKRARDAYAGDSRIMDSMKSGRAFTSEDPDEVEAVIAKMSSSEKEAWRLGVLQRLQDEINSTVESANTARNMIKTPRRKRLLRMTFPPGQAGDDKFAAFMANMNREQNMAVTERAGGNSLTAQRSEMMQRLRDQSAPGNMPNSLFELMRSQLRNEGLQLQQTQLTATANELAKMLTETDPARLNQILKELQTNTPLRDVLPKFFRPESIPAVLRTATNPFVIGTSVGGSIPSLENTLNSAQQKMLEMRQQQ